MLVLSGLGLLAFFVRGLTGAASSIVFNACFALAVATGLSGGLSLLDGLYWMALANALASVLLVGLLSGSLRIDRLTALLLVGLLPTSVVFSVLLPHVELRGLQVVMGLAVLLGGVWLLRGETEPSAGSGRGSLVAAIPLGSVAGLLSGLFGMGGPILMLALSRTNDSPSEFRSRFTTISIFANLIRLAVLALEGAYGGAELQLFALTIPAIAAGLLAGVWAHRYVSARVFRISLGGLVTVAGVAAALQAFTES